MSNWQEQVKQPFTITTGDGKVYTPQWNPQESVTLVQEFNVARFNFRGLKGTLVVRGEVMGNVYDIQVYFTGITHLTDAQNFRNSAKNKKAWVVKHPFYGSIKVQPIGLKYDNSDGNITKITGQIVETIDENTVSSSINQQDKISIDKINTDTAFAAGYVSNVPFPKVIDLQGMTANIKEVDTSVSPLIKLQDDYNAFKNGVNTANSYIAQATAFPGFAIASIQSVISAPANFIDTETNKLLMLVQSYKGLYNYVVNLPKTLKALYESCAGTVVSAMCLAAANNNATDYITRPDVISVIGTILDTYNDYAANLDTLQSDNGGETDSYIPDADAVGQLYSLVSYTVSQLLVIAANAKQQNTYTLTRDDNVNTVAFQLYGTSADDTVDQLISDNDINYTELLQLKKGRQIIYYV